MVTPIPQCGAALEDIAIRTVGSSRCSSWRLSSTRPELLLLSDECAIQAASCTIDCCRGYCALHPRLCSSRVSVTGDRQECVSTSANATGVDRDPQVALAPVRNAVIGTYRSGQIMMQRASRSPGRQLQCLCRWAEPYKPRKERRRMALCSRHRAWICARDASRLFINTIVYYNNYHISDTYAHISVHITGALLRS